MDLRVISAISLVFIGCGLNNVFLEYIISAAPGSGVLITFFQFIFISVQGFFTYAKCGKVTPNIPISNYFYLIILFFITSVLNNWAFNFNIPVPLHMIFRAGSLIANMTLGIIILKKKYIISKYIAVLMISLGIVICTLESAGTKEIKVCSNCDKDVNKTQETRNDVFWWIIGIIILSTALYLSALMGILQEKLYKKHGKHPEEALFYTHLLSLPGFLIYHSNMMENIDIFNKSEITTIPYTGLGMPYLWLHLLANIFTQYLCISSVYLLTSECTSLTVTLVVTLRKFMSLLFSIIYFQNPFTLVHWFGTTLVFIGTLLFTEVLSMKNIPFIQKEKTS